MKRYIFGMSVERRRALDQISSFSPVIMEHMIKLLVYHNIRPNDINGWIDTVANWLHQADDLTIKPKAKKLKQDDILNSLFGCMGDDVRDYERALYAFAADNESGRLNYDGKDKYPPFTIDSKLSADLMRFCYALIENTLPLLLDKQDHTLDEYNKIVQSLVDIFCADSN